jgi:predicted O-linked N-acetylglucosamine transferase (SPINDLY family)
MSFAAHDGSIDRLLTAAVASHRAAEIDRAVAGYVAVLERQPSCFDALHLLGVAQLQLGHPVKALEWLDRAVAVNESSAAAHAHRGAALRELVRSAEALSELNRALELDPAHVGALGNRAAVLLDQGDPASALESADRALVLDPDHAASLYNRASALHALGRQREALDACERSLRIVPPNADLFSRYAALLRDAGRTPEALRACERALSLRPADAALLANRGHLLAESGQHAAAAESYRHAHAIDPSMPYLSGWRVHTQLRIADWNGLNELRQEISAGIDAGRLVCEPFVSLLLPLNRRRLRRCGELHARSLNGPTTHHGPPLHASAAQKRRLHIGYFSADFHDHPTAQLVVGAIEHHDRSRFEITGFALGAPIDDSMRARLRSGVDRFVDLHGRSDAQAAEISRQLGVDIAVDLGGYTRGSRAAIFLERAAAIQVAWLGFPGTSGSAAFEYMLADEVVVPAAHAADYSEEVIRLPHCYQPNDLKRQVSDDTPTRASLGLPSTAFVFCCFNNPAKITPEVFAVWMRLLRGVPESALWLLDENAEATKQLRRHAQAHGVDQRRLVFAPRKPAPEHLARHRAADLCLDTWPYNAHTTASDALWAGLPLLTMRGETFASRVAASLLEAVEMPELITNSPSAYESLAMELATDRERVAELRQRLDVQRTSCPLFDTAHFTRDLESAYLTIWERHQGR